LDNTVSITFHYCTSEIHAEDHDPLGHTGEICCCYIYYTNTGNNSCKNLTVVITGVFCFCTGSLDLNVCTFHCAECNSTFHPLNLDNLVHLRYWLALYTIQNTYSHNICYWSWIFFRKGFLDHQRVALLDLLKIYRWQRKW